jgi:hypothetical protein
MGKINASKVELNLKIPAFILVKKEMKDMEWKNKVTLSREN